MKANAARAIDKLDLERLLTVAASTGLTLPPPPHPDKDLGQAVAYLHGSYLIGARQVRRLLVEQAVPRPGEGHAFADL